MRFSFILFLAVSTAVAVLITLNALWAQESPSKVKPAVATVLNYDIAPTGTAEEQDLLEAIAVKMKIAERRLSEENPGDGTQKRQLEAIDLLNDLIREVEEGNLREVPRESPEWSRSNPSQPENQRQKALMRKADREQDPRLKPAGGASTKRWDVLRRCDRDDMIAASEEEFPQEYEKLLGIYYRWLLKK